MPLPNFIIVGAAKAGTTSLYAYLKQHPQVFMSAIKEPRYFAVKNKHLDWHDATVQKVWRNTVSNFADYQALFAEAEGFAAVGEASPIYLWEPDAAQNIVEAIPEVKIIAILRNPVDRAFSHFGHFHAVSIDTSPDFEAALAKDEQAQNFQYVALGNYYPQLLRYYQTFAAQQIKVFLFEDLVKNPQQLLTELYQFIGVSTEYMPDFSKKYNTFSSKHQAKGWKKYLPQWLKNEFYPPKPKPTMNPQTRKKLLEVYAQPNRLLSELIDKDLSAWKN
ncbi:MAG: sulfotransferase [Chitinophagales bacterium]|nr:sulfotransferase [Bacteroidota bacterium]MCB9043099.1 sulfotransferase [Chitinophagales bacterium]